MTYETVRQWCLKFGQTYANELRRRRHGTGDKWHMDEVFLAIRGQRHYLGIVNLLVGTWYIAELERGKKRKTVELWGRLTAMRPSS